MQQHDEFYMKEVRTFEEVFKSIKANAKDYQKKKDAILKKRQQVKRMRSRKAVANAEEEVEMGDSDPDFVDDSDLEDHQLCNMYNFALD